MESLEKMMTNGSALSDLQGEILKESLSLLLHKNFILARENKKEFQFILDNKEKLIRPILDILGFDIEVFEREGVIGLYDPDEKYVQETFGVKEIAVLLILKDIYITDKQSLSVDGVYCTKGDIIDRLTDYGSKVSRAKATVENTIRKCKKFNLVKEHGGETIEILPSLKMAIGNKKVNDAFDELNEKLKKYGCKDDGFDEDEEGDDGFEE